MRVSVSVYLSVSISTEPHAQSLPVFFYMLPMVVARSSSGSVTQYQGEGEILGVLFPIANTLYWPYNGMNFATMDLFVFNLLIYHKMDIIQFPVVKGYNCE